MNDETRLVIESAERFLSANYSFDQRSGLIDSVDKKITVLDPIALSKRFN